MVHFLPFLSRLAWQILSLTDVHNIALIPACIPTYLGEEDDYLSWGWLLLEWHLLHIAKAASQLVDLPKMDPLASSHIMQCKQYYALENPLPWGPWG